MVLALVGASVLLFWLSGVVIWWQARRQAPHITGNSPLAQADVLIFVASEGGSTWGFAQTLHDALAKNGHRVHTGALEHFQTTAATRQVFVLAATYGEGQAPAHASHALERIAKLNAERRAGDGAGLWRPAVPGLLRLCRGAGANAARTGLARAAAAGVHPPAIGPAVRALGRGPGTGAGRTPGAGLCAARAAHHRAHARGAPGLPGC